ncbi:MAG TPA: hypothetical protein VK824_05800, partial [Planctomycetota bacterium]|nr:hypothetical protein [Planctomycetota bacterium]
MIAGWWLALLLLVAGQTSPVSGRAGPANRPVAAAAPQGQLALAVEAEVERLANERSFWPHFQPLEIPLAVYDGERTLLFRHPAPPEGFARVGDDGGGAASPGAFAFTGRHPAVTSNTSADLGGTVTATLRADGQLDGKSATDLAAVALHESFHVFQRQHHAGWAGNEGDLFLYPVDDARLLALRRLESSALRRALAAGEAARAAGWARLALGFRRERFAAMEPAFPAYERLSELNEGLATYVQTLAAGATTVDIPEGDFPPVKVRDRIYAVGPALAFLLDRFSPGWQAALQADDSQSLDGMLEAALGRAPADGTPDGESEALPSFAADEIAAIERTAAQDVAAVNVARTARRKEFDGKAGWRVVVQAAADAPLWPQGFDPLNVERVDGGVVHARFLELGNDSGRLQMLDEQAVDLDAFTEGVGPHPIFNGIRRVTVAGLAKPVLDSKDGEVSLHA